MRLHAADYVCQQGPDLSRVWLPENQNIFDDPSRSGDVWCNIFTCCNNHAKNLHALDMFAGKQAVANAFSLGLSISSMVVNERIYHCSLPGNPLSLLAIQQRASEAISASKCANLKLEVGVVLCWSE